ncbi:MAG: TonB family protein [Rickettsiales bacterium]|nr:TonB family protein [Rickettsiales bacterium]
MQHASRLGHVIAVSGTLAVHTGLAAWAMQPDSPIAIPQQQVIQVAMISAPVPQEKIESALEATPPVPPKPIGMKKVLTKKEVVRKKEYIEEKPKQMAQLAPASGPQAAEADAKNAAFTQPIFDAVYLRNPPPAYPATARLRGIEGKVLLNVDVSNEGTPEHVTVSYSSGSSILDAAARQAVERWHFIPARRGSESIAATVIVPIIFRLKDER